MLRTSYEVLSIPFGCFLSMRGFYLMDAGVFATGVVAFSADFGATFSVVFFTSLTGSATAFGAVGETAEGVAVVVAAKALTEIRPAIRVAISLLISWTFQLFVKSSN
jgi:hypothetical protein